MLQMLHTTLTQEFAYLGSKHLSASNFDIAYSRGWTGKGLTIVIADTGANTAHTDLDGNIYTQRTLLVQV